MKYIFTIVLIILTAGCGGSGRDKVNPVQPIAFSHRIHAGQNSIPCLYCHSYAGRSKVAGLPSVERCMGCHKIISTEKPEIQKLSSFWEGGKTIEWIKMHDLPDFVYFTHKRHTKKGIECSVCHGNVKEMDEAQRVSSLEMGWCVQCHRERGADDDCLVCHK